jgi:hypothetical protein
MFERLILCEYAVTDLTAVNASRRHGLGPMDKRRQSVGLEPLAEYAKHFGLEYHSK